MRLLGARPAMSAPAASGEITGISGIAARIEAMLPIGVRPRQLSVRTLLAGHAAWPRPITGQPASPGCTRRWPACPKTSSGGWA